MSGKGVLLTGSLLGKLVSSLGKRYGSKLYLDVALNFDDILLNLDAAAMYQVVGQREFQGGSDM